MCEMCDIVQYLHIQWNYSRFHASLADIILQVSSIVVYFIGTNLQLWYDQYLSINTILTTGTEDLTH